jgi:glycosyltransferase involved in cell wall biosynthesis
MVVWLNNPFDPLPGEGGRPLRYGLLCRALAAAGHEVVWWSSDFHHVRKRRRAVAAAYAAEGFSVRLVPTRPYGSNTGWARWRSHLAYAAEWERLAVEAVAQGGCRRPDLLVVSQPPLGLFDAAARLRARWGCRVALDIQDAWPEVFYLLLPRWAQGVGRLVFSRGHAMAERAYRGADGVSAVCARYAELARRAGAAAEPRVFRLGTELPAARVRTEPPEGGLRLCCVGNLGVSYDLRTVVGAVCELAAEGAAVTLEVAGDGPLRRWVESAAGRPGSPVRFHGYLGEGPLRELLGRCDAGVVPMADRSWVAVPNKVVDYAAAGLAQINGLSGESLALLNRYEAGLGYAAGSRPSFKQAALRYAGDRALLRRHQINARRMAGELFDAAKIFPELARWLARVAEGRAAE